MLEIRDPIHGFIVLDDFEKAIVDSAAFQRLRYIHQLALGYLVYPGAQHTRFEHSLGTMELAGRAFDALKRNAPELHYAVFGAEDSSRRWRSVIRAGALLHDIGHGPFSHAGDTLFKGTISSHEEMGHQLISNLVRLASKNGNFRIESGEVAFIGTGDGTAMTQAELIGYMLVAGELGVDRMDYLYRDSRACGVNYGLYDLPRLVETLTLLKHPDSGLVTVGLQRGGLHAAEGLLTARYFMFSQVYFHKTRHSYDEHLVGLMNELFPKGFPEQTDKFLELDDLYVLTKARSSIKKSRHARAIVARDHFVTALDLPPRLVNPNVVTTLRDNIHELLPNTTVIVSDKRKSAVKIDRDTILIDYEDSVMDILDSSSTLSSFQPISVARVFSEREDRDLVAGTVKKFLDDISPGGYSGS